MFESNSWLITEKTIPVINKILFSLTTVLKIVEDIHKQLIDVDWESLHASLDC